MGVSREMPNSPLGLIRLEFRVEDGRIGGMQGRVASTPAENKLKLLDRVRNVIRIKHYSSRTEQAYVDWIKRFILFHGKRHPLKWRKRK
jgi:hypothetical protein